MRLSTLFCVYEITQFVPIHLFFYPLYSCNKNNRGPMNFFYLNGINEILNESDIFDVSDVSLPRLFPTKMFPYKYISLTIHFSVFTSSCLTQVLTKVSSVSSFTSYKFAQVSSVMTLSSLNQVSSAL